MVAIKTQSAAAFLSAPPKGMTAALFFGTDPGLVAERAATLAKTLAAREDPPGEIVRLDDESLAEDEGRIAIELQTRPMFASRRIIRAIAGRRINAALLKPVLSGGPLEGLLIVEAGNLKPDDALRQLFEKQPAAAAVACYPDSAADIDGLITEVLDGFGLKIDRDARLMLMSRLGADRSLSRAEIDKLALYGLGRSTITVDDVDAIVGDAAELAVERIVDAAARGEQAAAMSDYGRALAAGENAQAMIAVMQRHFLKLHKARGDIDNGSSQDDVLRAIRPPLHFKQRDNFAASLRIWTRPALDQALKRIAETAEAARLSSRLADTYGERLILALSAMAQAAMRGAARRR